MAADYAVARADALAHTAMRFIECARAQVLSDWAQRRLAWAELSVQTASNRTSTGAGSSADVKRLKIAAVRARIALARAQSRQRQARGDLAAMWGAPPSDVDTVSARCRR